MLWSIRLEPLVHLVRSVKHVVTCVEIKRLAVLMIRVTGNGRKISLAFLKQLSQLGLSLECTKRAID